MILTETKRDKLQGLSFNLKTDKFEICSDVEALRYLKGLFTNKERFIERYVKRLEFVKELKPKMNFFIENYEEIKPFSYSEAFALDNQEFKALVFGSINIAEMMENLGKERLKVEGKEVIRKIFSPFGEFLGNKEYHNIYETYEVNGEKLGLENNVYALRCWCTSTNKEHWLWIEEQYKLEPLKAVASTFRIHENLIPYIKELKRQGDIMLIELKEEVEPSGNIVPLTADQYFDLLSFES